MAALSASKPLVRVARRLRKDMSLPEVLLWRALRRRPDGFKFRRQCPQGGFVLDFVCLETRLGVEVDGEAHSRGDRPARDAERDEALGRLGFRVLRLPATDVLTNLKGVVEAIVRECKAAAILPGTGRGTSRRLVEGSGPEPLHRSSSGPPPRSGEDLP